MMPDSNCPPDKPVDQDALKLKALAKAVLNRDVRPRAASVRRLAQAVLDLKAEQKALKEAASSQRRGKRGRKTSKLARIPGQSKAARKTGK